MWKKEKVNFAQLHNISFLKTISWMAVLWVLIATTIISTWTKVLVSGITDAAFCWQRYTVELYVIFCRNSDVSSQPRDRDRWITKNAYRVRTKLIWLEGMDGGQLRQTKIDLTGRNGRWTIDANAKQRQQWCRKHHNRMLCTFFSSRCELFMPVVGSYTRKKQ